MKKIYISGSITNNPNYRVDFCRKYRELENSGKYIVLTPLMINAKLSWEDYMHIDFAMLEVCDVIYMMKGWEQSKGAKEELEHAKKLNLEIIYE